MIDKKIKLINDLIINSKFKEALSEMYSLSEEAAPNQQIKIRMQQMEWVSIEDTEAKFGISEKTTQRRRELAHQLFVIAEKIIEEAKGDSNQIAGIPTSYTPSFSGLKKMMAEGKTEKVLDQLYGLTQDDEDLNTQVILLQGRWNGVKREVQNNTLRESEVELRKAKINNAIMELIKDLD